MQRNIATLGLGLVLALFGVGLALGYWQLLRAPGLSTEPRNPRRLEQAARVLRGKIVDRAGKPLAWSELAPDGVVRRYESAVVAPVTGHHSLRYGAAGLERAYDRELGGQASPDFAARLWSDLTQARPVGADLVLTLDLQVQRVAMQALGGSRGAIVALDPRDGGVLALAATPSYDPNRLEPDWPRLSQREDRPLFNRATQATYTPGSTFKTVVAAAAVDLGIVDLEREFRCTERVRIGNLVVDCSNHSHLATVDFYEALGWSCNRTFALTALGLGYTGPLELGDDARRPFGWEARGIEPSVARLREYARRFGFDRSLPFDLPVEPSRLADPGQEFFPSLLAQTGFGQGQVAATPLQMALIAAAIGRGGELPRPYLVTEVRAPGGATVGGHNRGPALGRAVSGRAAAAVAKGMAISVDQAYGRGAQLPGVKVAGKTGTAETGQGSATHAWFIGYAPLEQPRVAVAVILEGAGSGAELAAPAAQKVLAAALAAGLP